MSSWYLRLYPYFIYFLGISLLVNFFLIYYQFSAMSDPIKIIEEGINQNATASKPELLNIEITGAVNQPGSYQLAPGSLVNDVVDQAGGLTSQANLTAADLNLASLISPDQKIFIPSINSTENDLSSIFSNNVANITSSSDPEKININTANLDELEILNGVGEKTAQKIIDYRVQKHFDTVEEIMEVSGIGPKMFEKIKSEITI